MRSGSYLEIPRWDSQSDKSKAVWRYYDQHVATSIINEALKCKSLTLVDLYHALSMARLKCEWVKEKSPATQEEIEVLAKAIMPNNYFPSTIGFGGFQHGGTTEMNTFDDSVWGTQPVSMAKARIDPTKDRQNISLSMIDGTTSPWLTHPTGPVLERLQDDFKRLIETRELFEFVKNAARMMFELSNYPPIGRGSMAVHTWMINKIFQNHFKLDMNILPPHPDWFAFYLSPEQYTSYFVTFAVANYLKQSPVIYEKHKPYFDNLWDVMLKDPNIAENLAGRELAWGELKKIVLEDGRDDVLLKNAKYWNMLFRKPSLKVDKIISDIQSDNIETADLVHLKQLLVLDKTLSDEHLKIFGNFRDEHLLNELWADLGVLRKLPIKALNDLRIRLNINEVVSTSEEEAVGLDVYNRYGHGMLTEDQLLDVAPAIDMGNKSTLKTALRNGGMTIAYAATLTKEQLEMATSNVALLLYSLNKFIRASDFVSKSKAEMQNNMLRLLAKSCLNEELDEVMVASQSAEIITALFDPIFLELYRIGNFKISPLFEVDGGQFHKSLLKLYISHYFNEKDASTFIDSLSNENVNKCIEKLAWIFDLIVSLNERSSKIGKPNEFISQRKLKASALMQLDDADFGAILIHLSRETSRFSNIKSEYDAAMKKYQESLAKLSDAKTFDEEKPSPGKS